VKVLDWFSWAEEGGSTHYQGRASILKSQVMALRPNELTLGNLTLADLNWLTIAFAHLIRIDESRRAASCQLGRSLLVAKARGLDLAILASDGCPQSATAPELPDVAEELEGPDGYSIRIL
jgi:hypothetical protein